MNKMIACCGINCETCGPITVNASPYGHEFYKKLGFVDTSEL